MLFPSSVPASSSQALLEVFLERLDLVCERSEYKKQHVWRDEYIEALDDDGELATDCDLDLESLGDKCVSSKYWYGFKPRDSEGAYGKGDARNKLMAVNLSSTLTRGLQRHLTKLELFANIYILLEYVSEHRPRQKVPAQWTPTPYILPNTHLQSGILPGKDVDVE
ncbi:MAG: hypothetical protein Q9198_003191 [Flavoplaca austrocitrina]